MRVGPRALIIGALSLCLGTQAVMSAVSAAAVLDEVVQSDARLSGIFAQAVVDERNPYRAEIVADQGLKRHAIVAFKVDGKGQAASLGAQFCRAALSRPERRLIREGVDLAEDDPLVADALTERAVAEVEMRGIELGAIPDRGPWSLRLCSVPLDHISVPDEEKLIAAHRVAARFAVAEDLAKSGRAETALNYFRLVREDPVLYRNAIPYVVALLRDIEPELSYQLREEALDWSTVDAIRGIVFFADDAFERGAFDDATGGYRRCLELESQNRHCETRMETARKKLEEEERKALSDLQEFMDTNKPSQ